jgi:hypothetical protein
MSKPTKPKFGPNEFDTRVRERYLANGTLDEKTLEKHLHELKDVAAQAGTFELRQPAFETAGEDESGEGEG